MEVNGLTTPSNTSSTQFQSSSPPDVSNIPQKLSMLSNLFQGRLNRGGYFAGHFLVGFGMWIVSTVLILILSIIVSSDIAVSVIYILIVGIAIFFSISLSVRRLHDLNKSGFLIFIIYPIYILGLLYMGFKAAGLESQFIIFISYLDIPYRFVVLISGCYLLLWPGSKTENKYGKASTHWTWKEILGFAAPPSEVYPSSTSTVVASKPARLTKIMLNIIIGMIIFIVIMIVFSFVI